jgi:hypothetical protein
VQDCSINSPYVLTKCVYLLLLTCQEKFSNQSVSFRNRIACIMAGTRNTDTCLPKCYPRLSDGYFLVVAHGANLCLLKLIIHHHKPEHRMPRYDIQREMYVVCTVSKRWSRSSDTAGARSCLSRRHCLQPQSRYPSNLKGGGGGGTGGGTGDDSSSESEELVFAPPLRC